MSRLELSSDVFNAHAQLANPAGSSDAATEATLGFNWYLNRWVRMQFNYEHSWFAQPVQLGTGPAGLFKFDNALLTRLQLIF